MKILKVTILFLLAALIGCKRGTHTFSDGLAQMKADGYVVDDPASKSKKGNKVQLADTAFLTPEDRKEPEVIDPSELAKFVEENAQRKKAPTKEKEAKPPRKATKKKAGKGKDTKNEDSEGLAKEAEMENGGSEKEETEEDAGETSEG